MPSRLDEIIARAEDRGFDFLALVPGPSLYYSTGLTYHLSERPIVALLPVDAPPAVIVPEFEAGKARALDFKVFTYLDEDGPALAFHEACTNLEISGARIGVENLRMRLLEMRYLERYAPEVEIVNADDIFADARMCKDERELAAMRKAVDVAETAFLAWLGKLKLGMNEREASAKLVGEILNSGADGLAFGPIVAGGPNGGLPHATPGDRPFQAGDWVVVDWGAQVDGYNSDLTRMLVFGNPGTQLAKIHQIVLAANQAGRNAAGPGIDAEQVDGAARDIITDNGYGEQFTHRCGHGLGLESHEPPYLVQGNTLKLKPGMTFTIEPGIYIDGVGGVRIEDNVVVTSEGCETLTSLSRAPFIIHS